MEIPDYPSNSFKSKEMPNEPIPEKKIEKVVTGSVKTKKKSGIRKFTDIFIAEDVENVKSYVIGDVLIPALKKALDDIVSDGIHMILYGESGGRSSKKNPGTKVSYQKYYDRFEDRSHSNSPRQARGVYDYDDILLESRSDAEDVIDRLTELMDNYEVVSVADFYDTVGVTGEHTDNKYGWTRRSDICNAPIVRTRDGYIIKFPRPRPID